MSGSLHVGVQDGVSSSSISSRISLSARLGAFLAAVRPSKGFFINLADTTCKDTKFSGHAHQGQHCWNGVEIGAYNRTIVGAGLAKQEHNPEMKVRKHDGANTKVIDAIVDKLLRIQQSMVKSPVTRKPELRQRDPGRGTRNAQPQHYGNYNGNYNPNSQYEWRGQDEGSGYYDNDDDKYYDDEDLYEGSGGDVATGSGDGVYDVGSGGYGAEDEYARQYRPVKSRKPNTHISYVERPQQPKATKNPAQNTHNYVVNPVKDNGRNGGVTVSANLVTMIGSVLVVLWISSCRNLA